MEPTKHSLLTGSKNAMTHEILWTQEKEINVNCLMRNLIWPLWTSIRSAHEIPHVSLWFCTSERWHRIWKSFFAEWHDEDWIDTWNPLDLPGEGNHYCLLRNLTLWTSTRTKNHHTCHLLGAAAIGIERSCDPSMHVSSMAWILQNILR